MDLLDSPSKQDGCNSGKKSKNRGDGGQNGGNNNNWGGPQKAQIPRFRKYTPLTETVAIDFRESKHRGIFNLPPGIRTPINNRDNSNYYRYHCDKGHTTEECRVLKDKVERLIQGGQLREYVRGANQEPRQPVQHARLPSQDNQEIEVRTIMGELATDDCRGSEIYN